MPCGNTVTLVGVDQLPLMAGALTILEYARNIAGNVYNVSPVVKVAVKDEDKGGKDLPELVDDLNLL